MGLLDFLLMRAIVSSSLITGHAFVLDRIPKTVRDTEAIYKTMTELYREDEGLREDR